MATIAISGSTGHPETIKRLDRVGWPHLRKPFHLDQLLLECAASILEAKQNIVRVGAALDRLLGSRDEPVVGRLRAAVQA